MKLYLSSSLPPDPEAFVDFVGGKGKKLGLVFNAKDDRIPEKRSYKAELNAKYFGDMGLSVEEIDLRDYHDGGDVLSVFKSCDVIYFYGGSVYLLRWALSGSGIIDALKEALHAGVVYAGNSAGAIVAGPSLKHYEIVDYPELAPEAFYDGLGLVDFCVIPHVGSKEYPEEAEASDKVKSLLERGGNKTIGLTDSEYLLVENGTVWKCDIIK